MPRVVTSASLILVFSLLAACGGSTDVDGSGGAAGSAGSGASAGSGGSGASAGSGGSGATAGSGGSGGFCESFVPCCDSSGNEVSPICPSGMPECPPGASWPPPGTGMCSGSSTCSPQKPCASDEYCDYSDDLCGAGDDGTCKKRPQGCGLLYAPVCGCDGNVAGNECSAQSAGQDVSAKGGCTPPSGTFGCGMLFCNVGTQYCQHSVSDVGGWPDSFSCNELPSSCGSAASCACLAGETCGTWCDTDAGGNLKLTCPGG